MREGFKTSIPSKRLTARPSTKYYQKQSSIAKNVKEETKKHSEYLETFSNINDQTGLRKAYNNNTDNGLYYHPDNRTL